MPTPEHSGGCLCGGVRYSVSGELRPVIYCYCGQCKKTSGNFVAATGAMNDEFRIERDTTLRWFAASEDAKRGFCNTCGSNLFWRPTRGDHVSIFAGTLDSGSGLEAQAHIFVESKPDYLSINDGLPQHEQYAASGPASRDG